MEDPTEDQIAAALGVLRSAVPTTAVLGIYLYGSAVAGGLKPDSDIDLIVVTQRRLNTIERHSVVDGLMPISGQSTRPPRWRPLEMTFVVLGDVRPWRYPPRIDLQYGEWLRDQFIDDSGLESLVSPDLTIALTSVRESSRTLHGPPPGELLDPIPAEDLTRAMLDELPVLVEDLADDTRNVILTLARIWVTMESGRIMSKDVAAAWAIERLGPGLSDPIGQARDLYLRGGFGPWKDQHAVERAVGAMQQAINGFALG